MWILSRKLTLENPRNIYDKGVCDEVLAGNMEYFTEHQRKDNPCYKPAENFADLCSTPGRKGEQVVGG